MCYILCFLVQHNILLSLYVSYSFLFPQILTLCIGGRGHDVKGLAIGKVGTLCKSAQNKNNEEIIIFINVYEIKMHIY